MPNPLTSIRNYLKSSVAELKKVSWPSRDMTIRYSALVIIAAAALAGFFAALDFGLSRAVTLALESRPAVEAAPEAAPVKPDLEPLIEATGTPIKIEATPVETKPPAPVGQPSNGGLELPPLESPKP